jgi:uncharacterized spore protein YtfJ
MNAQEILTQVRDSMNVKRVFGEPYEKNGLTVIPVASIAIGGGAGEGADTAGHPNRGGGYGLGGRAMGAFVIKGDNVRWLPAVDVNRLILGAQIVAIVALFTVRAVVRERTRGGRSFGGRVARPAPRGWMPWRRLQRNQPARRRRFFTARRGR